MHLHKVFIAAIIMHLFMWFLSPPDVKAKLVIQKDIFHNKHTWIMTWLYIMSFGCVRADRRDLVCSHNVFEREGEKEGSKFNDTAVHVTAA